MRATFISRKKAFWHELTLGYIRAEEVDEKVNKFRSLEVPEL